MIQARSPKGGNPLKNLWAGAKEVRNLVLDPSNEPHLMDDFLVWKVGYASEDIKKGGAICIKRSDFDRLFKIFIEMSPLQRCQCGGVEVGE